MTSLDGDAVLVEVSGHCYSSVREAKAIRQIAPTYLKVLGNKVMAIK